MPLAMFYRKNLHVWIVDKGIEEVGCLSKQCVGLPWDWGHLKRYITINSNKKMSSKGETYRRIHANTKPESWVFFRLWWSRHLLCKEIYLLMLLFYGIIMIISYQLLTWSPTRSFFKTSCGTLQPHPFNLVKLVNLEISIFENPSRLVD